jgi:hypothetical protein
MILAGLVLSLLGVALPLLMVMQILQSTYALNFASFTASVLGLILGITGAASYVGGHRK